MKELNKALIIVNTYKEESRKMGVTIKEYLESLGKHGDIFLYNGFGEENPFHDYDFVVTLGGDGTVLFAARGCAALGIPIFPVNFGTFGFIASVQKPDWKRELDRFLAGKSIIAERSMIKAALVRGNANRFNQTGLNDIVISAKNAARTISFDITYDNIPLGEFKADGIIIATATGSTAYSASAGGPIIDPDLDALVLTLMNAFSLSSRPIVLSPLGEIGITILPSRTSEVTITVDGQIPVNLHVGDIIKIRRTNDRARLVGCTSEKFYQALRSKLNWSGGPSFA
ncbi:MAG: NAD(+)/NADH kinase [Treponemataceae bacterium]|nr:NAD(+)/NADH kinase [Treponemataceae bacterium]MDE7392082.1 NAD(+)/NADH kinase [Treponemataceae bacterium]